MCACNSSTTWKMQPGGTHVQNQPGIHSEFKASLKYIVRSCLKEKNRKVGDGSGWVGRGLRYAGMHVFVSCWYGLMVAVFLVKFVF